MKRYHIIHRAGLLETYCFIETSMYRHAYIVEEKYIMYGHHLSKYTPIDEIIEEAKKHNA